MTVHFKPAFVAAVFAAVNVPAWATLVLLITAVDWNHAKEQEVSAHMVERPSVAHRTRAGETFSCLVETGLQEYVTMENLCLSPLEKDYRSSPSHSIDAN